MSRQIKIGNLTLGGGAPVRVQSMTNTDTMDTQATVEQALRMVEAGCELVRITAPDVKAAENLGRIKEELLKRGCEVPLVADIHFNPKAAEVAATLVEKVRVNPGNYTDRNTGKLEFTEQEYNDELKRIGERMASLINICKAHHTVMRIGTNHGSLSERIMSRYGNTPEGMAQSAIEFAEVCRQQDFHDLVFSMKASNVKVMVDSTRLFVAACLVGSNIKYQFTSCDSLKKVVYILTDKVRSLCIFIVRTTAYNQLNSYRFRNLCTSRRILLKNSTCI